MRLRLKKPLKEIDIRAAYAPAYNIVKNIEGKTVSSSERMLCIISEYRNLLRAGSVKEGC